MNKRSTKLDKYIGQKVTILFCDGDRYCGVLGWQGAYDSNNGLKPFSYYLQLKDTHLHFRKSHVRKIEVVE